MRSIKHGCVAHFSIKSFYTLLDVVEITFYRWTHIQANGDPIHGACDPRSTSQMLAYTRRKLGFCNQQICDYLTFITIVGYI
jgi:hypothetical protein